MMAVAHWLRGGEGEIAVLVVSRDDKLRLRIDHDLVCRGLKPPSASPRGVAWPISDLRSLLYPASRLLYPGALHEYNGHDRLKSSLAFRKPAVRHRDRQYMYAIGAQNRALGLGVGKWTVCQISIDATNRIPTYCARAGEYTVPMGAARHARRADLHLPVTRHFFHGASALLCPQSSCSKREPRPRHGPRPMWLRLRSSQRCTSSVVNMRPAFEGQ